MRKKIFFMFLLTMMTFLLISCNNKNEINTNPVTHDTYLFNNPVFDGDAPDPSIIRAEDGYFYVYTTEAYNLWIPGEMPFKSYGPILRSSNLTEWEYVASVFESMVETELEENFEKPKKPSWSNVKSPSSEPGIWAPDVIFRNNQYYYYYSLGIYSGDVRASGIGVATSETPYGPWIDHGKIFDGYDLKYNHNVIDANVKVDSDGKVYMFFGSYSNTIDVVELDNDGLRPKYNKEVLGEIGEYYNIKPMFSDEVMGGQKEGTYIIEMYGSFYAFFSTGGLLDSYKTIVLKGDSLLGEYYDANGRSGKINSAGTSVIAPYYTNDEYGKSGIGTGHVAVIEDDDGVFWLLYHATVYSEGRMTNGRRLALDRLIFTEDGFPYVKGYKSTIGQSTKAPYIRGTN